MTKISIIPFLKSGRRPDAHGPAEFLRLFKKHKSSIYRNLDSFGMNFAQLSFPLLYSRCCAGFYAEERPEFLLVTNNKRHLVLPLTDDRQTFMKAVLELIGRGGKLTDFLAVPSMPHRPNRYPEFICKTEFLATLPGQRVKSYRNNVRRLSARGIVVEEGLEQADDLLALNSQWYADFEYRKGFKAERFQESEAIISLAGLHPDDKDLVRVFRATIPVCERASEAPRRVRKLCGFLITCRLSESYWAAVLSRTLFEYSGLGHYLFQEAARLYLQEGVLMENDGAAGSDPALSATKQRLASDVINSYRLRGRWLARYRGLN